MIKKVRGAEIPAVGFGTFRMKGETCRRAVADALSLGYRHIDTARAYENEAEVGRAIAESGIDRDAIFLTTKIPMADLEPGRLERTAEAALRDLGQDYVDLLLIHWPSPDVPMEESLDAMTTLRERGLTRFIGVSNFTTTMFRRAAELAPVIGNQVEYHPYLRQDELLDVCRDHGLMLTAYRSFANGEVHTDEVLQEIASRYGKSPAQVVLRWQIQQEPVLVIPKAASDENRRANFDVFDFELDDEAVSRIDSLGRGERFVDPHWAPAWER